MPALPTASHTTAPRASQAPAVVTPAPAVATPASVGPWEHHQRLVLRTVILEQPPDLIAWGFYPKLTSAVGNTAS